MSIDHNRIKVADLEQNQPNKILTTNQNGELEFTNINSIKTDNYNALDYVSEGKSLDARQGKILKDLIDSNSNLLASDNVNLNTLQKLVDAIETLQSNTVKNDSYVSYTHAKYWGLNTQNWYIRADTATPQITTDSGTQVLTTALTGFAVGNNVCVAPFDMKLVSICAAMRPGSSTKIGVVKGVPGYEHVLTSVVALYESPSFVWTPSRIIDLDSNQPLINKGEVVRISLRQTTTGAANSSDTFTLTFKKV